jgi:hypothetical protein
MAKILLSGKEGEEIYACLCSAQRHHSTKLTSASHVGYISLWMLALDVEIRQLYQYNINDSFITFRSQLLVRSLDSLTGM